MDAHIIDKGPNPNYSPFDTSPARILCCEKCDTGVSEKFNYCPKCGAKLIKEVPNENFKND